MSVPVGAMLSMDSGCEEPTEDLVSSRDLNVFPADVYSRRGFHYSHISTCGLLVDATFTPSAHQARRTIRSEAMACCRAVYHTYRLPTLITCLLTAGRTAIKAAVCTESSLHSFSRTRARIQADGHGDRAR